MDAASRFSSNLMKTMMIKEDNQVDGVVDDD